MPTVPPILVLTLASVVPWAIAAWPVVWLLA
jgi:hypothetical protein